MEIVLRDVMKAFTKFALLTILLIMLSACIVMGYIRMFLFTPVTPLTHVRLNMPSWPGFMIAPLAEELGYMREEGIKVGLKDYPDKSVLDESDILPYDVRGMLAVDLVEEARRIRPLGKIVLLTDRSVGGDALIARDGAEPIQSSKKKRITGDDSYPFFYPYVLDLLNGNINDFESDLSITQEEVLQKLKDKKVDYAMTYEPYLSQALADGAHMVFSSKDAPGVVTDTLIFSDAMIDKHPEIVFRFVRAYMKAYAFWRANPDQAYRRIQKIFKRTPGEFESQMKEVEMLGLSENHDSMFSGIGLRSIYGNIRAVQVYENRRGEVKELNVDALVYPNAIQRLYIDGGMQ